MELWEVLVPKTHLVEVVRFNPITHVGNKGFVVEDIPLDHHKLFDDFVKNITDGLTIGRTNVGYWVDNKDTIREKMIQVRIYCTQNQINEIVEFTAKHYQQKAVMFYKVSDKVFIYKPTA